MEHGSILAQTDQNEQVLRLSGGKVFLGLGSVMLPMNRNSLGRLEKLVSKLGRELPPAESDLAYIHCDPYVIRVSRDSATRISRMLIEALRRLPSDN